MSLIEVKHLRKEFDSVVPLKDVNATVEEGEVVSIIGPSGTGKSTFIRCLNRLETPTSGQIIVDGQDITAPGCDVSKIRQKMGIGSGPAGDYIHAAVKFGLLTLADNKYTANPEDLFADGTNDLPF